MTRFFDKRLIVVSGKGGTGKTTVATAIAVAAARRGKRVLVAELNVREKVSRLFGREPSGYEPTEVREGIETVNLTPGECLREYGIMKLRFRRFYELVFENEVVRRLLKMLPGVNEILLLGKIMFMEEEVAEDGRPRWDLIVVDAPATGHSLALLRIPKVILDTIPAGPLRDDAERIQALLQDDARTCCHIVTLPEDMPVREAEELHARLQRLGIPVGPVFINAVWPEVLTEEELALLPGSNGGDDLLASARGALEESAARRAHQEPHLARARQGLGLPTVEIPFVFADPFDIGSVETIADLIDSQLGENHGDAAATGRP